MSHEVRDVFISYSTKDQEPKNFIREVFDNQSISYFLDENDLALGEDIEFSLKANLKNTRFTILLVSKNSLFSTWVCLESIHRLQEESFTQKTTFLPILVDLSVMSLDFPLEMARHFRAKLEDLEAKRVEAKQLGIATKLYNDEIERIEKVLPQIGEIIQKIKNGLSANFADENRKPKDLEKLLKAIQPTKSTTQIIEKSEGNLIQQTDFQYTTDDWGLQTSQEETDKFKHQQIKPEEESSIWVEYQDFNYPEINFEIQLQFISGLSSEEYFGFQLNAENYIRVIFLSVPNRYWITYDLNGETTYLSEDWQESPLFELSEQYPFTLRIQIIDNQRVNISESSSLTFNYYLNSHLIASDPDAKISGKPNFIYIFSTDKLKFKAQYLKIFTN